MRNCIAGILLKMNIMRRLCFVLFLIAGHVIKSFAQSLNITVEETGTGNAVPGVLVKAGTLTGQTNMDGFISLPVTAFPATVEVSGIGYETVREKVSKAGQVKIRINANRNILNETVVTGVPRPMKLQNALSNYTIINRTTIDGMGAVTLADALPTQLNINLNNDQMLGSGVNMLGMNGDKVKVLIDGMPVNGRENGNIDLGQMNLNNVERIEIVKGPMSIVYGNDAMGGIINLITKKRKDKWDASATANYESNGKYNFNASGSYRVGRSQLILGGGRNYFAGWGDLDTGLVQRRLLFKPKEQYLANAGYNYTAKSGFRAQLASDFLKEKVTNKGAMTGYPYTATAMDEYYRTTRSNNRLSLDGKLGKEGLWSFQNGYAYYRRVRRSVVKDLTTLNEQLSSATGSQDTSTFHDITLRSNYSNHYGRLRYDGGYDVLLQSAHSKKFGSKGNYTQDNYALYLNTSYNFFKEKLTAQLGVRAAYNTMFSSPVTMALNLLYKPAEEWQMRASYARAYRAPTLKEMYLEFIDLNHHIIGNPSLRPEEGNHLQASISHQYKIGSDITGQWVLTGFYDDARNQITLSPADTVPNTLNYTYGNIARLRNVIVNLQTDLGWKMLSLNAGFAMTRTLAEENAYDAFNVIEANLNARYYFSAPEISLNVFYKYTGNSRQFSSMATGKDLFSSKLSAFHTMNISLERSFLKKKLQVIAGMKNVLDTRSNFIGSGSGSGTGHGGDGGNSFLPRSIFTTVNVRLN